jgi:hypothetical protein
MELNKKLYMMKYLLCRPRGGLNDTLCQIEACWSYCEKYNRRLIIDTKRSGIFVDLSELFVNTSENEFIFNLPNELIEELNKLSCQIKVIEKKIDIYKCEYEKENNYVESTTREKLTFDFSIDHKENLLLHEQCGGGTDSINLLKRLKLTDELKKKFNHCKIEGAYKSIHIRNTDYKTNHISLLNELKEELSGQKVLVCSDNQNVVEDAKTILSESDIISKTKNNFSEVGKPLHSTHNNYTYEQKKLLTENSIIDLLLLANSEKIYYSNLSGFNFVKLSGFTKLSILLNQHKDTLNKLIE